MTELFVRFLTSTCPRLYVCLKEVMCSVINTQQVVAALLQRCQQTWAHYGVSVQIRAQFTRLCMTPASPEMQQKKNHRKQISLAKKKKTS